MNATYRRPGQLKPEQIDLIEGSTNLQAQYELAHTLATALVPLGSARETPEVVERVQSLIESEGIDSLAEAWVDSPEDSLPGILWRGYLLREWIRRFPDEVKLRYDAATSAEVEADPGNVALVPSTAKVKSLWDDVFAGGFDGDFSEVIRQSARLTDLLARVEPVWIDDDGHPLATAVTRRDIGMMRTAVEFRQAGERLVRGELA